MRLTRFTIMEGEVIVRPVIARVSSVSHHHVFVLDVESKLFLFAGRHSCAAELAMAERFVNMILSESDTRALTVLRVSEDKKGSEQFFELLGGDASLVTKECVQLVAPPHLSVFQDNVQYPRPSLFSFASLPETGCAFIDARFGPLFIWAALRSSPTLRDRAIRFAQDMCTGQHERPVEFIVAGGEPALFKLLFLDWPSNLNGVKDAPLVSNSAQPASATLRRKGNLFRKSKNVQ
jgi:hypothetical protein